jgi:carbamoyltransferase
MGLFPYGKANSNIPQLFSKDSDFEISNRNLIVPTYPNGALVNSGLFNELKEWSTGDVTLLQNRRDMAYAVQTQTQAQVLALIKKAVEKTGQKKVVLSGGYGLNCVANYWYLDQLKDTEIELYVEPISNDAGTAMGAALFAHYVLTNKTEKIKMDTLYLGPKYNYSEGEIVELADEYGATICDVTHTHIVDLLISKNIVGIFQGRSENGPRALGNRSLLFDPRFVDGKDFVNQTKHREYFRPFAGSILEEDVDDWFDLRGMKNSPFMMYAVNCKPGVEEKIPSIIHIDGTCRIQTVSENQNPYYYSLIKHFKEKTGVPILFNTSFNLGGEPLIETLNDALWTLKNSEIKYLYLPEYGKLLKVDVNG